MRYDFTSIPGSRFFLKIRDSFRQWRIKRYKQKKIKKQKLEPIKDYKIYFKIGIRSEDEIMQSDQVFEIVIPAAGIYFARKKLEKFVVANIEMEVLETINLEEDGIE